MLSFWINAFIPKTVTGYTKPLTKGTHMGKTAVPLPVVARLHPLNDIKVPDAGFLTDQRGFSSDVNASVRMQSKIDLELSGFWSTWKQYHRTSGTIEVAITTGTQLDRGEARMSRCSFMDLIELNLEMERRGLNCAVPKAINISDTKQPDLLANFSLEAAAGDPLVWMAADIDYTGVLRVTQDVSARKINVSYRGRIDNFPAFEAYVSYGGETKTLFQRPPPPGNTVTDLLGPAKNHVSGEVEFAGLIMKEKDPLK